VKINGAKAPTKENDMTQIYKAHVYEIQGTVTSRSYFEGEIDGVNLNTNVRELQGEPCVFVNDTKADLLASMISHLKASGKTGVLRLV
jgi:hypothetical protein